MQDDILSVLSARRQTFSKGQRRIADYINESYDKAAFMTASRLGKLVGVSESTVVRFAMELGYDGYPSMQKAMQEMVLDRLTPAQRIGVADDRIGDQDVLASVLHADIEKLRQTNDSVNREEFQASVDAILRADNIYILGAGSAATLAEFAGYYIRYMFENVHTVTNTDTASMFEKLIHVSPNDVIIAFSFPKYSKSTGKAVHYCRSMGATVIGVTNSVVSPLANSSEHLLIAKSDMLSLVDSLVAPLSLVNALLVALAGARKEELSKTLSALEQVCEDYNVYEKSVKIDEI